MAVNTHENGGDVQENQEWANHLLKECFFEENENENLRALTRHYLKDAIKFPAEFISHSFFVVLDVPQLYLGANLQIEQYNKHEFLKPLRIRVSIEAEQREKHSICHVETVDIIFSFRFWV